LISDLRESEDDTGVESNSNRRKSDWLGLAETLTIVTDLRNGDMHSLAFHLKTFPQAPLVPGQRSGKRVIIRCPYCGKKHTHGGYGHRTSHCGSGPGTTWEQRARGYILCPPEVLEIVSQNRQPTAT
jgi:hypothetical protein